MFHSKIYSIVVFGFLEERIACYYLYLTSSTYNSSSLAFLKDIIFELIFSSNVIINGKQYCIPNKVQFFLRCIYYLILPILHRKEFCFINIKRKSPIHSFDFLYFQIQNERKYALLAHQSERYKSIVAFPAEI